MTANLVSVESMAESVWSEGGASETGKRTEESIEVAMARAKGASSDKCAPQV